MAIAMRWPILPVAALMVLVIFTEGDPAGAELVEGTVPLAALSQVRKNPSVDAYATPS